MIAHRLCERLLIILGIKPKDHLGRDDKDFAIEHAEYMARAAEHYLDKRVNLAFREDRDHAVMELGEAWAALRSRIYEFRKRAARAGHKPSAERLR